MKRLGHLAGSLVATAISLASPEGAGALANEGNLGTLRGTVVDAGTGLPTPCTVTLVDAAGYLVLERESLMTGFRCDGRFSKPLPAGRARLRITRGFETRAVEREVVVPAGGEVAVEVRLERIVDLRRRGWYAGDSHVHMLHGERTVPVAFADVALAAQAEDLQYLSLAQAWTLDSPTPECLQTELRRLSGPHCLLTWNLEAPKNYYRGDAGRCLGHCWTLGMRGRTRSGEDAIQLLLQASAHDYEVEKPSFANFESHDLIHALGGTVFYSHPARWWMGAWGGQSGYPKQDRMRVSNLAVEVPLDTLVGPSFDGLDVMTGAGEAEANALAFRLWCLLVNHGYRVAATASSDSCFDRRGGATPGVVRTYTFIEGGFSWPAVARATAQGRTFVTSGPLLLATVDGKPPGSALVTDRLTHHLVIEAWPSGADAVGLTRLEIWRDGEPMRTNLFLPPVSSLKTNISITAAGSTWYCVRIFGGDPSRQRAISGAFFFDERPFRQPRPVPAQVRVNLLDSDMGARLSGSVTEVTFSATQPRLGRHHPIAGGEGTVTVPATARLRAEAPGHRPRTLSLFLDNTALLGYITQLGADDLVRWETFERIRALLGEVGLTFELEKSPH